ncbi:lysoplasmalogenase [Streptomyces boluensis]|uniref:Lysoplasmalogenase n=1 Tax=Streptomyces boluensis TaxID=1775135 RepID=A0A964XMT7_9ACTN|nr:lysoplasmalogenase [Streptomyces boluensis]NBE54894.1 lysoplasmalogenase [Streptomyces boluensis]
MTPPRLLLAAFGLALAGDLGSLLAGFTPGHLVFKPLLMPLLAGYAVLAWRAGGDGSAAGRRAGVPGLLLAALIFGWGGDTLLLFDAELAFLGGMASFAFGHVCYLTLFARYGTARAHTVPLGIGYAVALAGTVALLWPDLPADLRIPVAGYSLLLTAMAFRSVRLGLAAGVGGALFLLSDTLIATGVAEWPQLPRPDFWIMLTYAVAQFLLTRGALTARPVPTAVPEAARTSA